MWVNMIYEPKMTETPVKTVARLTREKGGGLDRGDGTSRDLDGGQLQS